MTHTKTKKNIDSVEIGKTYVSGNLYNPDYCTVTRISSFDKLPNKEKSIWRLLLGQIGQDAATVERYVVARCKDGRFRSTPEGVFLGTRYHTIEDMAESYAR